MHYEFNPSFERIMQIASEQLRFFYFDTCRYRKYIAAVENDKMVGMVSYGLRDESIGRYIRISAVSVMPEFKNQGIATNLLKKLFSYAKKNDLKIYPGFYEKEGLLYIKHKFEEFSTKYSVQLISS